MTLRFSIPNLSKATKTEGILWKIKDFLKFLSLKTKIIIVVDSIKNGESIAKNY